MTSMGPPGSFPAGGGEAFRVEAAPTQVGVPLGPCGAGYSLQYVGTELMCVPDADYDPSLIARASALAALGIPGASAFNAHGSMWSPGSYVGGGSGPSGFVPGGPSGGR